MFDFLSMADNHDSRKVDRYEKGGLFVDTCSVTDGEKTYETAVAHPKYNSGEMVIVESYDTAKEAKAGHDKWVKAMTSDNLPEYLMDCGNARLAQLCESIGGELSMRFPRQD